MMVRAGVVFRFADKVQRLSPVRVDFDRLVYRDSLPMSADPAAGQGDLRAGDSRWADDTVGLFGAGIAVLRWIRS